jgi:hypothetical protein
MEGYYWCAARSSADRACSVHTGKGMCRCTSTCSNPMVVHKCCKLVPMTARLQIPVRTCTGMSIRHTQCRSIGGLKEDLVDRSGSMWTEWTRMDLDGSGFTWNPNIGRTRRFLCRVGHQLYSVRSNLLCRQHSCWTTISLVHTQLSAASSLSFFYLCSSMAPTVAQTKAAVAAKVKTRFHFLFTALFPRVPLETSDALAKQVCTDAYTAIALS